MGRHLNIKVKLTAATLAAAFILSTSTGVPAQALPPVAQFYPSIPLNAQLARDADTFESDKALNEQCRTMGKRSAVCLCVTHVMKYELTLSEYYVATRLYGQAKNRNTLYQSLKSEGYKPAEINMAEEMERSLTEENDFDARCKDAKAYYRNDQG